jgi:hypothetical protein
MSKSAVEIAEELSAEFARYAPPFDVYGELRRAQVCVNRERGTLSVLPLRASVLAAMNLNPHCEAVRLALEDSENSHILFEGLILALDYMSVLYDGQQSGDYCFSSTCGLSVAVKVAEDGIEVKTEGVANTMRNKQELKAFIRNDLMKLRGVGLSREARAFLVEERGFSHDGSRFTKGDLTIAVAVKNAQLAFEVLKGGAAFASFVCVDIEMLKSHMRE